jgi:hypothetical protein
MGLAISKKRSIIKSKKIKKGINRKKEAATEKKQ